MRAITLTGLIAISAFAFAQEGTVESPSEFASLESVFDRLAQVRTVRGQFSQQRVVPGLSAPLASRGRFIVSEAGFYWEQQQPFRSTIIADGDRLTQIVGDQEPTTISTAEQPVAASIAMVFLSVFQGDQITLEEQFEMSFNSSASTWQINLEPVSYPLTETISQLQLNGRLFIDEMIMTGPAQDTLTIQFLDVSDEPPNLTPDELALYSP
jgi:outer membrane lipoprotein-sorting protein